MHQVTVEKPVLLQLSRPHLLVVVDTEEEFDWDRPFDRNNRSVLSIPEQHRAHELFDRYGVKPTYVVDYCVADDDRASRYLSDLARQGRCRIGAHLHPWVNPPYDEEVCERNSFHGNLPIDLERAKIGHLTRRIADSFGTAPAVFKAGRYGLGPNSLALIREAGYSVDCSFVPFTDFRAKSGPSYLGCPDQPFWLDAERTFLEIPLTKGFFGRLPAVGRRLQGMFDSRMAHRLAIPGILSRLGLASRSVLSPEGVPEGELVDLLRGLVRQGKQVFTITYHSPSLAVGHTPYVRTPDDLQTFLRRLEAVLKIFRDEVGGAFTTAEDLYAVARKGDRKPA